MFQVDDYCFIWNNQTLFPSPDPRHRFQLSGSAQCHLVVALFPNELKRFVDDPNMYICSSSNQLLYLILRYLQCSISLVISPHNFGGAKVNNTWTGILSLFEQKKADLIPHVFSLTGHRDEIIYYDFMMPQRELVTVLSHPKKIDSQNPLKLFKCFTPPLWLLILGTLLAYGWLYWHNIERHRTTLSSTPSPGGKWHRLVSAYLDMFALTIGQGSVPLAFQKIQLCSNPLHLYILVIFTFRHLFSSDITAVLLSQEPTIIDHFEQLEAMPHLGVLLQRKSSTQVAFNAKFPRLVRRVVEIGDDEMAATKTMVRLIRENYVMVINGYYGESLVGHYAFLGLHLSSEGHLSSLNNYAIRKTLDARNKARLTKLFRYIFYTGLHTKHRSTKFIVDNFHILYRTLYANKTLNQLLRALHDHKTEISAELSDDEHSYVGRASRTHLMVCLYIYSFGIVLSFVYLLGENLVHRYCVHHHHHHQQRQQQQQQQPKLI